MFPEEQAGFWETKQIISRINKVLGCYPQKNEAADAEGWLDSSHDRNRPKRPLLTNELSLALEEVDSSSLLGFPEYSGFSSFLFYHFLLEGQRD